jgi:hypothetical protein
MKRSQSVLFTVAIALGLSAMAGWSALAGTVFDDPFAGDVSNPTNNYVNLNTISATLSSDWSWANGTGITVTADKSGAVDSLAGAFTPVTLVNAGDYVSLVVNFNIPSSSSIIYTGANTGTGSLLMALDTLGETPLGTGYLKANTTGGSTANAVGYNALIAMDGAVEKTSTKLYAKTATGGDNEMAYYSYVGNETEIGGGIKTAPALVALDSYTLTYTITALNAGASQMQMTADIYDKTLGADLESYSMLCTTTGDNTGIYLTPTSTFNTFELGIYTGTDANDNINLTEAQILTNVPEPSSFAFAALGLVGLVVRFFRRR